MTEPTPQMVSLPAHLQPAQPVRPVQQAVPQPAEQQPVEQPAGPPADASLRAEVALEQATDAQRAEAETAAEPPEIPPGSVAVPLAGELIHVIPRMEWTTSAVKAVQQGDFDEWAWQCLAPGEFDKVWSAMNGGYGPKLGDVTTMFDEWGEITGESVGKARALPPSLRSTARR